MKKRILACALLLVLLTGCAPGVSKTDGKTVAATTWPVAQFAGAVVSGTDITVTRVISEPVSCLHDYSLSVDQMKAAENSQAVVISGAGLEDFMHCGQIVALIGPNGAGKSTLLKCILGQREYEGSITFHPAGGGTGKLRIGYVPQSPTFDRGDPVSVLDLFACCIGRRPAFLRPKKAMKFSRFGAYFVHKFRLYCKQSEQRTLFHFSSPLFIKSRGRSGQSFAGFYFKKDRRARFSAPQLHFSRGCGIVDEMIAKTGGFAMASVTTTAMQTVKSVS